jgi:hypothetical protein
MIEALNLVGVVEPCLALHRRGRGYMGQRPLTKHSMANKCCRTLFISIEECQGPIPRVPRATSYGLINLDIVQFPPAAKWLGNQVHHTRATPSPVGSVSIPFLPWLTHTREPPIMRKQSKNWNCRATRSFNAKQDKMQPLAPTRAWQ